MTQETSGAASGLSARLLEGWHAVRDGRLTDAEALFSGTRADCPYSADAVQGLAWVYLCGSREDEGDRLMNLIANFRLPGFFKTLATLYQETGAATVPRTAEEALLLSHHAQYQNNVEEALRLARRARSMAPGKRLVESNYGSALLFSKNYDEAIELLQSLTTVSRRPVVWHNLGCAQWLHGSRDAACHSWLRALEIVPDYILSHQSLRQAALLRFRPLDAYRHHLAARQGIKAAHFAERGTGL